MRIKLIKTFTHNNKEYKELNFDFDKLTGQDLIDAEEITRRTGANIAIGAADFSRNYLVSVAAKAASLPREALLNLSAQDFTNVLNQTLIFLSGADSVSLEEKNDKTV